MRLSFLRILLPAIFSRRSILKQVSIRIDFTLRGRLQLRHSLSARSLLPNSPNDASVFLHGKDDALEGNLLLLPSLCVLTESYFINEEEKTK